MINRSVFLVVAVMSTCLAMQLCFASPQQVGLKESPRLRPGMSVLAKLGKVVGPNTLIVRRESLPGRPSFKVLMWGIECPSPGSKHGKEAVSLIERLASSGDLRIGIREPNRSGHGFPSVVYIIRGQQVQQLQSELVSRGLAKIPTKGERFVELLVWQKEAQKKHLGIWGPKGHQRISKDRV